ncbi:MAG: outer membrane lipoprotein-sorting protein [Verrucomicrobiae bacterium]|nr:outer membrane lipoprotein-sorting protein [Verrucomicrobiae bacterium]
MKLLSAAAAMLLLVTIGAVAQTTNALSGAEIQGRSLALKIISAMQPADDFTNTGVLKIKDGNGTRSEARVECLTVVTPTNWQSIYQASWTNKAESLRVIHAADQPDIYAHDTYELIGGIPVLGHLFPTPHKLSDAEMMAPFAGSDFYLADLGLEFFHWPQQKVLKREVHSSRGCTVLESTNPEPATNGYSRVMSWIDTETLGIVEAYAYDAKGKQLKIFQPKDFKKVNGQWQVQTFLMENVQTGSRSRLEFDLKK